MICLLCTGAGNTKPHPHFYPLPNAISRILLVCGEVLVRVLTRTIALIDSIGHIAAHTTYQTMPFYFENSSDGT